MSVILNEDRINELKELDEDGSNETLKALVELYVISAEAQILKMKSEFDSSNFADMKKTAHSIRSSSLNLGAELVASQAQKIEYAEAPDKVGKEIEDCLKSFHAAKSELLKL